MLRDKIKFENHNGSNEEVVPWWRGGRGDGGDSWNGSCL